MSHSVRRAPVAPRSGARSWLAAAALGLSGSALAAGERAELEAAGRAAVEPTVQPGHAPFVLTGATVFTGERTLSPGWVAVADGRIRGVGEGAPPAGLRAVDVAGAWVTAGLIDTHSHLGVYPSPSSPAHQDGNEATAPTTPGVWAEHSVWPQDPGFQRAIAGGVTALQVLPGSANLIGGRGVVLRPIPARGSRAMRFPGAPETMKMACGENPKRVYGGHGQAPSTRMGNLRGHREAFLGARKLADAWNKLEEAGKKKPDAPERDLDDETLVGVLEGEILVQVHCYRADDMISIMQLADEVGFEIRSFHHAVEAYKIRDLLAERGIAVSTWADWWGFKLEAYDAIRENLGLVDEAGGRAVVHSDSAEGIQRLNQEAGKALAASRASGVDVDAEDALRWITVNPAWVLGIDDQVGSLTEGKRADLVVWSAHPLSVYAKARWVFIDGVLRWDDARPAVWSDFELGQEVP